MKISQKHIQYILLLLIVVIAVCAYEFGYVKYIEKANQVKEENKALEARINTLTEKESHRDEWNAGIDQFAKDSQTILTKYGPGNTPEKSIMFIRSLEEAAEMTVPSIAFSNDSAIFVSSETDENGNPVVELDSSTLSINYSTTYDGLKKCMDFINSYPERMNVNGFNAAYNHESGQLSGSMVINLYGVKDADHKYVEPTIYGVDLGVDNIFGTYDPNAAQLEAGEANGAETGNPETAETGTEGTETGSTEASSENTETVSE